MNEPNLLVISLFAFTAVFLLLAVLAVIMYGLTVAFPEKPDDGDGALLSAIVAAAAQAHPGLRVIHVEENR
jgi:hypothetical protein